MMEFVDASRMRHIVKNDRCVCDEAARRDRPRECVQSPQSGASTGGAHAPVKDALSRPITAGGPPVLAPLCGLWTDSFSAGSCRARPELRSSVVKMACTAVARRRHPDWLDRENDIRPQVGRLTQKASSHKVGEQGLIYAAKDCSVARL